MMIFNSHGEQMSSHPNFIKQAIAIQSRVSTLKKSLRVKLYEY